MGTSTIFEPVAAHSAEEKKQRARASKALSNARQRCSNPNNKDYANYGGQGIKVFLANVDELIAAIGLPTAKASLDRIDPHGHYSVENVRWASKAVQAANKKGSAVGSMPSLAALIAQQKMAVHQEQLRPKAAEAWQILLKALNRCILYGSEDSALVELLSLAESALTTFRSHKVEIGEQTLSIFRLPSLTTPNAIVEARGPLKPAPDNKQAIFFRHGILFGLHELEGSANVPNLLREAIDKLLSAGDCPGLTLVGRPSEDDLASGWFEIWLLAAASRLPKLHVRTAFFPVITCLQLLKDFGAPYKWDEIPHPLLDARLLFIPDLQLDCGAWGNLRPDQNGMLERLLKYRIENGHQTIVGVQAPLKLTAPLQKILLGAFEVVKVANGTRPPGMPESSPLSFASAVEAID